VLDRSCDIPGRTGNVINRGTTGFLDRGRDPFTVRQASAPQQKVAMPGKPDQMIAARKAATSTPPRGQGAASLSAVPGRGQKLLLIFNSLGVLSEYMCRVISDRNQGRRLGLNGEGATARFGSKPRSGRAEQHMVGPTRANSGPAAIYLFWERFHSRPHISGGLLRDGAGTNGPGNGLTVCQDECRISPLLCLTRSRTVKALRAARSLKTCFSLVADRRRFWLIVNGSWETDAF
jgi:hypothetical protein